MPQIVDLQRADDPRDVVHKAVQLLAEGRTNKDIATLLSISYKTVDAHRANIMKRLAIHSVAELVRYAIRERIIQA